MEEGDLVREAVDVNNLLGLLDDGGHIDTNHMLGTSASGEPFINIRESSLIHTQLGENPHAENTGTTTDIENNLVLEDVAVLVDGVAVGTGTDIVFLYW